MRAPVKLFLASSNPGKLAEYRELAAAGTTSLPVELKLIEGFAALPEFAEDAPTFAENAAGKAIHYSRLAGGLVFADDSGLVVPTLGGAPGVHSARYAGPSATNTQRIAKLLNEMQALKGSGRAAHFVCVIALAKQGRTMAVVTNRVNGEILGAPRGSGGFGYDPVFYVAALGKTFAEIPTAVKNQLSHRGKAFQRLLSALSSML